MRKLQAHPHPAVEVYPCCEDIGFWRVLIEGPSDTVYARGCWLAYVRFPPDYPQQGPEFRFVTPIHHCNVNTHGKICHPILDREWLPDMTMNDVFGCVYGLLLSPDKSSPLDSNNALAFYDDSGGYEAKIIEHVKVSGWVGGRVDG
jgi:ubiquitin-protein ligase